MIVLVVYHCFGEWFTSKLLQQLSSIYVYHGVLCCYPHFLLSSIHISISFLFYMLKQVQKQKGFFFSFFFFFTAVKKEILEYFILDCSVHNYYSSV